MKTRGISGTLVAEFETLQALQTADVSGVETATESEPAGTEPAQPVDAFSKVEAKYNQTRILAAQPRTAETQQKLLDLLVGGGMELFSFAKRPAELQTAELFALPILTLRAGFDHALLDHLAEKAGIGPVYEALKSADRLQNYYDKSDLEWKDALRSRNGHPPAAQLFAWARDYCLNQPDDGLLRMTRQALKYELAFDPAAAYARFTQAYDAAVREPLPSITPPHWPAKSIADRAQLAAEFFPDGRQPRPFTRLDLCKVMDDFPGDLPVGARADIAKKKYECDELIAAADAAKFYLG